MAAARRQLHFNTIDEAVAEADRLVAAEGEGRLTQSGNWTLGQALGHLATWATFPFEGYPAEVRAPLPVRMILGLMKNRILTKGMMAGVRIRGTKDGTLGVDMIPAGEGLSRYRAAMERIVASCPAATNP